MTSFKRNAESYILFAFPVVQSLLLYVLILSYLFQLHHFINNYFLVYLLIDQILCLQGSPDGPEQYVNSIFTFISFFLF